MEVFSNIGHDRPFIRLLDIANILNVQQFLPIIVQCQCLVLILARHTVSQGLREFQDVVPQHQRQGLCCHVGHSVAMC
jgi:hypothetical protein